MLAVPVLDTELARRCAFKGTALPQVKNGFLLQHNYYLVQIGCCTELTMGCIVTRDPSDPSVN